MSQTPGDFITICPKPIRHTEKVVLGHGSGGLMTDDLIRTVFQPYFTNPILDSKNDFAALPVPAGKPLITSIDSHIISPLFFSGGDIGRLAVCGTVNDVSMAGAEVIGLSAGFIIEEGTSFETLHKIACSMQEAALEAGIPIIAGDTKVVNKGKGDQVFITTAGYGWVDTRLNINGANAQAGDSILVSGTIGDHGMAVVSARGELGLETTIQSDIAPLNHMVKALVSKIPDVHVLRDPTRGGLGTTLCEIAEQSQAGIRLIENQIPVRSEVASICSLLGFDPIYVANEGKLIVICPSAAANKCLEVLQSQRYGSEAAIIGTVTHDHPGRVVLETQYGSTRLVDKLAGEMLPRIC